VLKPASARSDHPDVKTTDEQRTTYRRSAKAAVFVVAGVYGTAMMVALLVLSRPDAADGAELALGLLLSLWSVFRLSRCGIYADGDGIRVLNPLTSRRLRWDEIRRFVLADRGPCRVEAVDGSSVRVFGIQHSPLAALRRSGRTREAVMIAELNQRLDDRLGIPS
jgi:Bacterial PH domain